MLVAVVAGSWWPFVVVGSWSAWRSRAGDAATSAWVDPLSVLLVVTYIGLGAVTRWGSPRRSRVLPLLLTLPLLVEVGQTAFLYRHSQWADVLLGTVSLAVGWRLAGRPRERVLPWRLGVMVVATSFWALLAASLLLLSGVAGKAASDARLVGWQTGFPIVLGDEANGGRPWHGRFGEVTLSVSGFSSRTFQLLDEPVRADGAVLTIDGTALLEIQEAFSMSPQRFAVTAAVTPDDTNQHGPARIVTWSNGTSQRNFTLGQDGDAVVLRVRTLGNGDNGHAVAVGWWPGVLHAGREVRLHASYEAGVAALRVDDGPALRAPIHTWSRVLGGTTWFHGGVFAWVIALPVAWMAGFAMSGRVRVVAVLAVVPLVVLACASVISFVPAGFVWFVPGWWFGVFCGFVGAAALRRQTFPDPPPVSG